MTGENQISKEHIDNNVAVRKMLNQRGVKPEQLQALEDINKVRRVLENDEKNLLKTISTKKK